MKMIWCLSVMMLSLALNAMTTLSLNGATIGIASKQDHLIWHNVSKLSGEELTELCWSYFDQHLKPVADSRALTMAEYRMLLLCAFSEMCNASALKTELACMYNQDTKEYGCGFSCSKFWVIDKERLSRMEDMYTSRNYRLSRTYTQFVLGMKKRIYDDFRFKDKKTGTQLPTEIDNLIIKTVLMLGVENKTTIDKTVKRKMLKWEDDENVPFLEFLEGRSNENAILWDRYDYLFYDGSGFLHAWTALRTHYNRIVSRLSSYCDVIKKQANKGRIQDAILRREFADYWGRDIEEIRAKLHRCVYDAPYLLLVTLLNRNLGWLCPSLYSGSVFDHYFLWRFRDDYRDKFAKVSVLTCFEKMGDGEDVMSNLTTKGAVFQTVRTITLLKALLGENDYNAFVEQTKLLKRMQRVTQGLWEE